MGWPNYGLKIHKVYFVEDKNFIIMEYIFLLKEGNKSEIAKQTSIWEREMMKGNTKMSTW